MVPGLNSPNEILELTDGAYNAMEADFVNVNALLKANPNETNNLWLLHKQN